MRAEVNTDFGPKTTKTLCIVCDSIVLCNLVLENVYGSTVKNDSIHSSTIILCWGMLKVILCQPLK